MLAHSKSTETWLIWSGNSLHSQRKQAWMRWAHLSRRSSRIKTGWTRRKNLWKLWLTRPVCTPCATMSTRQDRLLAPIWKEEQTISTLSSRNAFETTLAQTQTPSPNTPNTQNHQTQPNQLLAAKRKQKAPLLRLALRWPLTTIFRARLTWVTVSQTAWLTCSPTSQIRIGVARTQRNSMAHSIICSSLGITSGRKSTKMSNS